MSLINDALKKAQKQRAGGEPEPLPPAGSDPAPRAVRRGKPAGPGALVIGAGVGAVVLIGVVALLFLRRSPAEAAPAKPAPVVQVPATQAPAVQPPVTKPVEVAPQPVVQAPAIVTPPPSNPAPIVIAAPVKTEPVPPKVETHAPVVVAPVVVAPPVEAPRVTAPGKLEPRAITFIESIRVAGIRASGSDRKVLMNDRVYRLGDLVEPEMGLTLVGIASNALTFQDERGGKYTRNF